MKCRIGVAVALGLACVATAAPEVKPPTAQEKALVEKWLKAAGLTATDSFEQKHLKGETEKWFKPKAQQAGFARDLKLARFAEEHKTAPDTVKALWRHELKVGMTRDELETVFQVGMMEETPQSLLCEATPWVWHRHRESAPREGMRKITLDAKTKKITSIGK